MYSVKKVQIRRQTQFRVYDGRSWTGSWFTTHANAKARIAEWEAEDAAEASEEQRLDEGDWDDWESGGVGEAPEINWTRVKTLTNRGRGIPESLRRDLLAVTNRGRREFKVGITNSPQRRVTGIDYKGIFAEMHILRKSEYRRPTRRQERSLQGWCHKEGLNILNMENSPVGKKPRAGPHYLYVIVK